MLGQDILPALSPEILKQLRTLAARAVFGAAPAALTFSSGYAIYRLLKNVFENGDNERIGISQ
jgi:hypothetical protein